MLVANNEVESAASAVIVETVENAVSAETVAAVAIAVNVVIALLVEETVLNPRAVETHLPAKMIVEAIETEVTEIGIGTSMIGAGLVLRKTVIAIEKTETVEMMTAMLPLTVTTAKVWITLLPQKLLHATLLWLGIRSQPLTPCSAAESPVPAHDELDTAE